MEVHHHPDLHHKRKQFREYFLEFLMIFLAVTMGFLAERLRDHAADSIATYAVQVTYIYSAEQLYVQGCQANPGLC